MVNVTQVGGNYVVECPHCDGTSECQFAEIVGKEDNGEWVSWFECSLCGSGLKSGDSFARSPTYPVCKVCAGKGYTVVHVPTQAAEQQPHSTEQQPAPSVTPQSQVGVLSVNEFLQMLDEEE